MALTHPLKDAAALMGVKVAWLQAKVDAREVPFVLIAKNRVGFTDEQIAQTIAALTVQPTGTPTSLTSSRAKKRAA